ncbi:hypothetical protein ACQP1G_42475 [Nocardia sp. CA-107356]|uniref:hypothetical protein n=1 Tax=Nocardia sp. CA-107356 TaxID=3239972 RepID=UPI003D904EF8
MTTTTAGIDNIDTDAVIEERRGMYRKEFGFNTFRDNHGAICMIASQVSAIVTTKRLGRQITALLAAQPTPVFSVNRSLWVFLTDPPTPTDNTTQLSNDLFRYGASPLYPGAVIVLPTPGSDKRCWLHPPAGEYRASLAAVVGVVETAATQASSR